MNTEQLDQSLGEDRMDTDELNNQLDQIEAYTKAATEGPWSTFQAYTLTSPTQIDGFAFPGVRAAARKQINADREFVARARTDMPALVATLRAMLDGAARR